MSHSNIRHCAGDVRVAYPLFRAGRGGSIPTSALELRFEDIPRDVMEDLNRSWHSRLPRFRTACPCRVYYGAEFDGLWYAVAAWSHPISRMLPLEWLELRRLAIHADAPRNTASRMLGWMRRDIMRRWPEITRLVSYQDTSVHDGTIYKAAGWSPVDPNANRKCRSHDWSITRKRNRRASSEDVNKIRWERVVP